MRTFKRIVPGPGRAVLCLGLLATLCGSGCNLMTPLALVAQPPVQTVPAEFDKLEGRKAAILVWAEPEVLFDYPHVRLEVAAYVADHLKTHLQRVEFISPRQVEDYLERQAGFTQDPVAAGRHFDVDVVIHITLLEFSMRDREMAQFYRGRVRAAVAVYDLKDKSGTEQRYALTDVYVTYPEDRPVGFEPGAAQVVRQKTYEALADGVGRKFYSYKKEV